MGLFIQSNLVAFQTYSQTYQLLSSDSNQSLNQSSSSKEMSSSQFIHPPSSILSIQSRMNDSFPYPPFVYPQTYTLHQDNLDLVQTIRDALHQTQSHLEEIRRLASKEERYSFNPSLQKALHQTQKELKETIQEKTFKSQILLDQGWTQHTIQIDLDKRYNHDFNLPILHRESKSDIAQEHDFSLSTDTLISLDFNSKQDPRSVILLVDQALEDVLTYQKTFEAIEDQLHQGILYTHTLSPHSTSGHSSLNEQDLNRLIDQTLHMIKEGDSPQAQANHHPDTAIHLLERSKMGRIPYLESSTASSKGSYTLLRDKGNGLLDEYEYSEALQYSSDLYYLKIS